MPAAVKARDEGASVIVVEANYDIGGHAIISGGNVPLGGGTSAQKKYGIEDSPDTVFSDLTDWTVVQNNGWPDFRYNDREVMRAFADHCAPTYEFLIDNGVEVQNGPARQSRRSQLGQFRAARESRLLDQRRGLRKSEQPARHGRDPAAGKQRPRQGRQIFVEL